MLATLRRWLLVVGVVLGAGTIAAIAYTVAGDEAFWARVARPGAGWRR